MDQKLKMNYSKTTNKGEDFQIVHEKNIIFYKNTMKIKIK